MPTTPYRYIDIDNVLRPINGGADIVVDTVPETPTDWQVAFDTLDMRGTQPTRDPAEPIGPIMAWYLANTGRDTTLDYAVAATSTVVVNNAWLNARNGNGRVSFVDGRWYVERYEFNGTIRCGAHNVTFRNIFVNNTTDAFYAAQSRAVDGNASGIVFDHCTFQGNWTPSNSTSINFSEATEVDQITLQYCDISGWRGGLYSISGLTARYNWVHDLNFTFESHNSGGGMRGRNNYFYRNLMADGNSACLTWYAEYYPYTNNVAEQNIFRLQASDNGVETTMTTGGDKIYWEPEPGMNRELIGNLFYRGGNRGEGGGIGGAAAPVGFTNVVGNIDRMGEAVVV